MKDFLNEIRVPDHIIQEKNYVVVKNKKNEIRRRKKIRKLKKQNRKIVDFDQIIDLHAHTIKQSLVVVQELLKSAENKGLRLQIITGKGKHTADNQVTIREEVIKFLMGPGSRYIIRYNFIPGNDGAIAIITT